MKLLSCREECMTACEDRRAGDHDYTCHTTMNHLDNSQKEENMSKEKDNKPSEEGRWGHCKAARQEDNQ